MKRAALILCGLLAATPASASGSAFLEVSDHEWFGQMLGASVTAGPARLSVSVGHDATAKIEADLVRDLGAAYIGAGIYHGIGPQEGYKVIAYDRNGKSKGVAWIDTAPAENGVTIFIGKQLPTTPGGFVEVRGSFAESQSIAGRFGVTF